MNWMRLAGLVDRQVGRSFEEPVRMSFLVNEQVDASRPVAEIRAVLETFEAPASDVSGGNGKEWRARLQAGEARLHIDRNRYPDLRSRVGDAVCAICRPGRPWFTVLSIDDRGDTFLVLSLGEK